MDDLTDSAEPGTDTDPRYVAALRQHLCDTRAHLAGSAGEPLPASIIPLAGAWTPSEKDAFFHALAVHSRWRPDLIAASVSTKSAAAVAAYLDALAEAAAADPHATRDTLPGALDVSADWVAEEEDLAAAVARAEPRWGAAARARRRADEAWAMRAGLRDAYWDKVRRRVEYEAWREMRRGQWGREDALLHLDEPHLKGLGTLLREIERGVPRASVGGVASEYTDSRAASSRPRTPTHSDLPAEPHTESLSTSVTPVSYTLPVDILDIPIDPALLALSTSSQPTDNPETHVLSCPSLHHSGLSTTPPESQSTRATTPPVFPATPFNERSGTNASTPDVDPSLIAEHLSPAARRRYKKMLYMRRKRAEESGHIMSADLMHIKPGRKAKERGKYVGKARPKVYKTAKEARGDGVVREDVSMVVDEERQPQIAPTIAVDGTTVGLSTAAATNLAPDQVTANAENARSGGDGQHGMFSHPRAPGMTLPYKIKTEFAEHNIDATSLQKDGLDLFNYSLLARIMQTYNTLYDIDDSIASGISVDTLQLLTAYVAEFTSTVVQHAIVLHEQEMTMKAHRKVWRVKTTNEIGVYDVERALEMVKPRYKSKQQYFDELNAEVEEDVEDEVDDEDEDVEEGFDHGNRSKVKTEDTTPFPHLLSLNRELQPPLLRLPPDLPDTADDALMSDETDDEALADELLDEADLDECDMLAAITHEAELWGEPILEEV